MDIYILQNGEETGPFSVETARALLKQGTVGEADFATRPGMEKWIPLAEFLATDPVPVPVEPVKNTPATKAEPATPKQKAFLSYFSIPITANLTRDQAALLVNDTMEEASNAARLARWNEERLRLHPELFAAEIQARKENRATHFFELCQSTGAQYFSGVAKAHCQVLVGFLDVKFPNWDAKESEAAEHYFFPAVAEKFPQLVHKEWRGRLHYADGTKISQDIVRKSPTSKLRRTATSPLVATVRGVVLGVVILGALYLGHHTIQSDTIAATAATGATPSPESAAPSPTAERAPAPAPEVAAVPEPASVAPQNLPPIEPVAPAPPMAQTEPSPATPPVATAEAPMAPAPATLPAPLDSAVATAPMAGTTPPPMAADPAMAPVAPMATSPTALDTAPMASLPGREPPVPVAPPPATMPMAGTLPNAPTALPEPAPAPVPAADDFAAMVPPLPVAPVAKTNLVLTKPVEVTLTYGKIMLAPGTPVKLVTRQGGILKVSYQNRVITIPAGSTDIE